MLGSENRQMNAGPDSEAVEASNQSVSVNTQPSAREVTRPANNGVEAPPGEEPTETASASQVEPEVTLILEDHETPVARSEPEPKRYLGGDASAVAFRPTWPSWFRIFLVGTFLAINLAALLALLLYPIASESAKPAIRGLIADDYASLALPRIDFAKQDLARVLGISSRDDVESSQSVTVATDKADIRGFFNSKLTGKAGDTLVAYVVANGFADENGPCLLPMEASEVSFAAGYPIEQMMEAIAASGYVNIAVLLDCTHFHTNLRAGHSENQFAREVKKLFEQTKQQWKSDSRLAGRNVVLMLSADEHQVANTSNALAGSPFALAVAYSLAGGRDADVAELSTNDDQVITVRELTRYCTETVANWSLDSRGTLQCPVSLTFGDDFDVASIDDSTTISAILGNEKAEVAVAVDSIPTLPKIDAPAPVAEAEKSEEKEAEPSDSSATKTAESPAAAKDDGGTAEQPVTVDVPIAKAPSETTSELLEAIATARDGNLIDPLADPEWLADHEALNRIERLLITDELDQAQSIWERWSEKNTTSSESVAIPIAASQLRPEILAVLQSPTARNLDALRDLNCFEAELLLALAPKFVKGAHWDNSEAIRLAVEVRQLLVDAKPDPQVFAFVEDRLTDADKARLAGEAELFYGRFNIAIRHLTRAASGFREASTRSSQILRSLAEIERAAIRLPWIIAALELRGDGSAIPVENFLTALDRFEEIPTESQLRRLASQARRFDGFVREFALNVVECPNRNLKLACLQIPDLPREIRSTLFESVRNHEDATNLRIGHRPGSSLAPGADRLRLHQTLSQFLSAYSENSGTEDLASWRCKVRHLVNAYWAPLSTESSLRYQMKGEAIAKADRSNQLTWFAGRIAKTHDALPIRAGQSLTRAIEDARAIDSTYEPVIGLPPISLEATQSESDKRSIGIKLSVDRSLSPDDLATLVVQSYPPTPIGVDGARNELGRFKIPLSNLVRGSRREFAVDASESSDATQVICSVRVGERIQWRSIELGQTNRKPQIAKLDLVWPDKGPTTGVAELMPNESLPIQLSVEKLVEDASGLSVEFIGDDVQRIAVPANKQKRTTVIPPEGFRLSLTEQRLTIRLLHHDQLIDKRELDVTVLDPRQCFRCEVTLDAARHRAVGKVNQLYQSDAAEPVQLRFRLWDQQCREVPLPSAVSLQLNRKKLTGSLEAAMPFSIPQPYHLSLDIVGVPRAIRYRLRTSELVAEPNRSTRGRFTSPSQGTRYAGDGQLTVPIQLQCDAHVEDARVFVGIDHNGNGKLEDNEQLTGGTFWFGRTSQLALKVEGKPPGLRLVSSVNDMSFSLDLSGFEGHVPLIAAINDETVASRDVYIVRSAPSLTIVSPSNGVRVPAAASMRVAVQANPTFIAAIDKVEFGFDKNQNGKFDETEVVAPTAASKFKRNGRAIVELPVASLKPGATTVFVRTRCSVVDAAGNPKPLVSEVAAATIDYVTLGSISGRVQLFDGTPVRGAIVTVPGLGSKRSGADGSYEFADVKPGAHTLSASTSNRAGTQAVKVQPSRLTKANITILAR